MGTWICASPGNQDIQIPALTMSLITFGPCRSAAPFPGLCCLWLVPPKACQAAHPDLQEMVHTSKEGKGPEHRTDTSCNSLLSLPLSQLTFSISEQ